MPVQQRNRDAELIDRVLVASDETAFEELIALHGSAVLARCHTLLAGSPLAEDAAQNTWVKAYFNLAQFRRDAQLRTWLLSIASRECYTIARGTRMVEDFLTPANDVIDEVSPGVLDLRDAFARLARTDRIVLWLVHVDGYRHAEVGDLLGLSEASVKMRASRAREKVRAHVR